jgi:hypothetical protein
VFIYYALFFFLSFSRCASPSLEEVLAICQENEVSHRENLQKSMIEVNPVAVQPPKNELTHMSQNQLISPLPNLVSVIEEENLPKKDHLSVEPSLSSNLEEGFSNKFYLGKDSFFDFDSEISDEEKRKKSLREYKSSCRGMRLTNKNFQRVDHRYFSKE